MSYSSPGILEYDLYFTDQGLRSFDEIYGPFDLAVQQMPDTLFWPDGPVIREAIQEMGYEISFAGKNLEIKLKPNVVNDEI